MNHHQDIDFYLTSDLTFDFFTYDCWFSPKVGRIVYANFESAFMFAHAIVWKHRIDIYDRSLSLIRWPHSTISTGSSDPLAIIRCTKGRVFDNEKESKENVGNIVRYSQRRIPMVREGVRYLFYYFLIVYLSFRRIANAKWKRALSATHSTNIYICVS